jgi:hypothetical protein
MVNPVLATILMTDVLRPDLILGFKAPEVPVYVIGRAKIGTHGSILQRIAIIK